MSSAVKFQREDVRGLWQEVMPLLHRHWAEVAHYKDIPLDPDYELYDRLEARGKFRAYTVRTDTSTLAGYAAFLLVGHPHYRASPQAQMDVIYLAPEHRGRMIGARFIRWCDEQLQAEGTRVVRHHLKVREGLNYGRLLERLGYVQEELIYVRRLAAPVVEC